MNTPTHDPERDAAAFLGGELTGAARTAFEEHLVACDLCWSEVSDARAGRALAEGLRESAPQDLRELLRAIAANSPDAGAADSVVPLRSSRTGVLRRRSARILAAAATIAVLGIGALTLIPDDSVPEAPLFAAAAAFQADSRDLAPTGAQRPVRTVAGMPYQGSTAQPLGGQQALVHRYADSSGHRVLLVSSAVDFPRAGNAEPIDAMGKNWIASVDGVQMLCVDHDGLSWLVISDSRDEALAAGREAGLV